MLYEAWLAGRHAEQKFLVLMAFPGFPLVALALLFCLVHHVVWAAPVAPNISSCHLPVDFPPAEPLFDCCLPDASYEPRLFRPSAPPSLRIRRPAHTASSSYAATLAKAYSLMKALPSHDPRSFSQQANIHCAYCNSAYNQLNASSLLFQVHGNWLFLPFHRWYLYFHERILAKLLGDDDTFALTFWNYDQHNATSIPWLYDSYNDTLVSSERDPSHRGPNATAVLDYSLVERPREVQLLENDYTMYRMLVGDASTQEDFFGSQYRQGDSAWSGGGSVETLPHNNVHLWMGNKSCIGRKDMGSFYASARDPVFYAHHAQIDRLWEIWRTLPDHEDLMDEDYLNSEFVFYNEDAELVRVKVGDALNASLLGYAYEYVEIPWIDTLIISRSSGPAYLTSNSTICKEGEAIAAPCSIVLQSGLGEDDDVVQTGGSPWLNHRLVMRTQGEPGKLGARIDIYVNLPSADATTGAGCTEFLYGFNTLTPATFSKSDNVTFAVRPSLYSRLVDLNLTQETSIVITLVPSFPSTLPSEPLTLLSLYSTQDGSDSTHIRSFINTVNQFTS